MQLYLKFTLETNEFLSPPASPVTIVPTTPLPRLSTLRLIGSVNPDFAIDKIIWAAPGGISIMKSEAKPNTGTVAKLPQVQKSDNGAYVCMVRPWDSNNTIFPFNVDVTVDGEWLFFSSIDCWNGLQFQTFQLQRYLFKHPVSTILQSIYFYKSFSKVYCGSALAFILLRTLCSSHLCILHPPPHPTSCFLASLLSTVNSVASFTNLTHGEWLCNRAVWNSCVSSLLIRRSRMPGQLSTSEHNPYCCRNFSFQFTLSYYSVLSLCLQLTLHPASFSSDFPVELLACTVLLFLHFCFFVLCLSDFFFLTLWFLSCFLIVCRSFNLHCHSGTDILYSNLSWGPGGLCSAILAPSRLQEAEKYDADVPLWQVEGFHMGGS